MSLSPFTGHHRRKAIRSHLTILRPWLDERKKVCSPAEVTRGEAIHLVMRGEPVGLAFQLGAAVAILLTGQQFLLVNVLLVPPPVDEERSTTNAQQQPVKQESTNSSADDHLTRIFTDNVILVPPPVDVERSNASAQQQPVKLESTVNSSAEDDHLARTFTESEEWVETVSDTGVIARAFDPWDNNKPLPCFAPDDEKHYTKPVPLPSIHKGFMFMKLMKTGGSTAAGINIRIMRDVAERVQKANDTAAAATISTTANTFQYCQGRFEHAWGYEMLADRERNGTSFTWTLVREPTKRVVSQFFHFIVSRKNKTATDQEFHQYLAGAKETMSSYYLQVLNTEEVAISASNAPSLINKLMYEYDFIGVTERMEETAVALMMLLNVKMGSILHLNAKGNGGYDDGGRGKCVYIVPSHVSEGMQTFFAHRQWQAVVHWDALLYRAANRSLDLTIDRLGRAAFAAQLAKFRHAQAIAHERCLPHEVFPCTSAGVRNPHKTCLWKDSGCGSDCLDEVASELGLW